MKKLVLFAMLLPIVLIAQSYTLDDLIEFGLEHSLKIKQAELSLQSSQSSLRSSMWNLMPDLSVNAGLTEDLYASSPMKGLSSSAGFSISKAISLNDQPYYNYRYSKLDAENAGNTFEQSKQQYAFDVFKAYIDVLSAQTKLSALRENLSIQNRVWDQSKLLLQLGKTTNFDVKQNEIAVMNSQIAIMQAENTITGARRRLFDLVQKPDEGYNLSDIDYSVEYSIPELDPNAIYSIQNLQRTLQRNNLNVRQARLDYFPSISLSYNYRRSVSGNDFEFDTYSTTHGLYLNMSYSLWSPFRNREDVLRARINHQMTSLNLESQRNSISSEYEDLLRQIEYLGRLDELYTEKLAQSREQIRIAEERYRLGLIELLELDKTRTDYIDTDIQFNANRYLLLQARESLNLLLSEKILGKW